MYMGNNLNSLYNSNNLCNLNNSFIMPNDKILKGNYIIQQDTNMLFGGKLINKDKETLVTFEEYSSHMFKTLNNSEHLQSMFILEKLNTKKIQCDDILTNYKYNTIYCHKSFLIHLYVYSNYYFIINKGFIKNNKLITIKLLPDEYDYLIALNIINNDIKSYKMCE